MIKVTVQVASGTARFKVAVQSESIRRAVQIVEGQNPGCEARVTFPIDPEAFFVGGTKTAIESVQHEQAA